MFGKAGHHPEEEKKHDGLTTEATIDISKRQKSLGHVSRQDKGLLSLQKMIKRDPAAITGRNQWITNIEEDNKQWDYLQIICTNEKKKSLI